MSTNKNTGYTENETRDFIQAKFFGSFKSNDDNERKFEIEYRDSYISLTVQF
jgi:hypothetical protein